MDKRLEVMNGVFADTGLAVIDKKAAGSVATGTKALLHFLAKLNVFRLKNVAQVFDGGLLFLGRYFRHEIEVEILSSCLRASRAHVKESDISCSRHDPHGHVRPEEEGHVFKSTILRSRDGNGRIGVRLHLAHVDIPDVVRRNRIGRHCNQIDKTGCAGAQW